jgi:excisionase family DNA binding protein
LPLSRPDSEENADLVELMLISEVVAERRHPTARTWRRWIDAGRIPHYRFGGRVYLARSDVDALLRAARVGPGVAESREG